MRIQLLAGLLTVAGTSAAAQIGMFALGGCGSSMAAGHAAPAATGPANPGRSGATDAGLEHQIFDLVNRHRTAIGVPALVLDPRISREARRHSAAMATGARPFGHDGFPDRIAALRRVMSCSSSAENISSSQGYLDPAPDVVLEWLASRGHRSNIEGHYDTTGVGVARSATGKVYFTQLFVGR